MPTYTETIRTIAPVPRSPRLRDTQGVATSAVGSVSPSGDTIWHMDGETAASDAPARVVRSLTLASEDGTKSITLSVDASGNLLVDGNVVADGDMVAYGLEGAEVETIKAYIDAQIAGGGGGTIAGVNVSTTGTGNVLTGLTASVSSDGRTLNVALTKGITASVSGHTHDDRYYTESEIDTKLSGKSDTGHNHDSRYYTESEVDTKLSGKSDTGHNHDSRYYTEGEVDTKLSGKSDTADVVRGGIFNVGEADIFTFASSTQSFVGTFEADTYYHVLSCRHRNGTSDGNVWGMMLYTKFFDDSGLVWRKQAWITTGWRDERTILDSVNFASYAAPASHTHGIGDLDTYGLSATGDCDYVGSKDKIVLGSVLAYWNGAYTGTASNLRYCAQGAFGNVVTHSASEFATADGSIKAGKARILDCYSGDDGKWGVLPVWNGASFILRSIDVDSVVHDADFPVSVPRLTSTRKIFGQDFNGTGDVSGDLDAQDGTFDGLTIRYGQFGARMSYKSSAGRWDQWTYGTSMVWSATNDAENAWQYDRVMRLTREGDLTTARSVNTQSVTLSNNGHSITLSIDADGNLCINGNVIATGDVVARN